MFTEDELCSLEYAVANLIQDKRDYCTDEEGVWDDIERLEQLQAKVQCTIRKLSN